MSSVFDHFDLQSAREVPDSYAWPELHKHPSVTEPVPVIDLADRDAARSIAHACMSWGAFQLTGHGIAPRLLEAIEAETRRLFALPIEQKLKAASSSSNDKFGYGPTQMAKLFDKHMWAEGFSILSPVDNARKLWPNHDHHKFCDAIEGYKKEMKTLSERLMQLMLISLGLKFEDAMSGAGPIGKLIPDLVGVVQLNSYPPCPDPGQAVGMVAHTDSSLFTIFHQSSTTGLQVFRAEEQNGMARWATVPLLPGTLIVLVGDLLQILTNGQFKSALHRVVVNQIQQRLSVGYFCGPPADVKVSPVVGPGQAPVYRAVTWVEYRDIRMKFFDKALASIKMEEESKEVCTNKE